MQALAAAHASVSQKPSTPKKHAAAPLRSPTKAPPKSKQWGNNSLRKSGGLPAEISDLNLSNSDDDLVMQRELEQLQAQHAQLVSVCLCVCVCVYVMRVCLEIQPLA